MSHPPRHSLTRAAPAPAGLHPLRGWLTAAGRDAAEFRENAKLTDPEDIARQRELALMELERLKKYVGMNSSAAGDLTLDL